MAEAAIPVDLLNPGQVFACLGLMEAAEALLGGAEGAFDWSGAAPLFRLSAAGAANPAAHVLAFLAQAGAVALAPPGSRHDAGKWGVPTRAGDDPGAFPFPEPDSPATLPCALEGPGGRLMLDHWGDATRRDNVKFWAGAGGYPGAALARDALALLPDAQAGLNADPFAFAARQSSSFRFDWRRDYVPVTAGFSPNKHAAVEMVGYPLVELLAALGMGCARPKRVDKLTYRYGVIGPVGGALLPPMLLRAALGAVEAPFPGAPFRHFRMRLDWPGQEDQARAITEVVEETET
jgi:CRISPR-associated protein Csx14